MKQPRMSSQTLRIMEAFVESPESWRYGYDLSRETGLLAGTLYPVLSDLRSIAAGSPMGDERPRLPDQVFSDFVRISRLSAARSAVDSAFLRYLKERQNPPGPWSDAPMLTIGVIQVSGLLIPGFALLLVMVAIFRRWLGVLGLAGAVGFLCSAITFYVAYLPYGQTAANSLLKATFRDWKVFRSSTGWDSCLRLSTCRLC